MHPAPSIWNILKSLAGEAIRHVLCDCLLELDGYSTGSPDITADVLGHQHAIHLQSWEWAITRRRSHMLQVFQNSVGTHSVGKKGNQVRVKRKLEGIGISRANTYKAAVNVLKESPCTKWVQRR